MKKLYFLSVFFICIITQVSAVPEINCTGSYGSISSDYENSSVYIWNINTGVNNKPVTIECNMDTDPNDIFYIYAVDNAGNDYFIASMSGLVGGVYGTMSPVFISTILPTGRAKVVFITDESLCGDPNDGGYFGLECYYEVDNSYPTHENLTVNSMLYVNGNLGIGTLNPHEALTVNGKIYAKEIILDTNIPFPDYVFAPDYKIKSLLEMEDYIKTNSHLPNMPSAAEVQEKGLNSGEMINKLLQTVEEQMLYIIEQNKEIMLLNDRIEKIETKK